MANQMIRATMNREDWLETLVECKDNVKKRIAPLLKKLDRPQPDLGVGAGGDPIKKVDLAAEKAIVETLTARGISFTLVSEESGVLEHGKNPQECYVTADPIDGTTNLERRIPFYATSIAVSDKPLLKSLHAALVADLFHDTTYTCRRGKGSLRDGRRIRPSHNTSLADAVIGIDLNSYKVDAIAPKLTELIKKTKHLRHFGANALELCYVADGTSDAFVDIRGKLRTTDAAAAVLILKEAGALVTAPNGAPLDAKLDPKRKVEFVASANAEMHRKILSLLNPAKEKE
jgi:myo-inositol-1(or 4)-monophosphatase